MRALSLIRTLLVVGAVHAGLRPRRSGTHIYWTTA